MTTSSKVPGLLPVAVDDHAYLCDPDYERATVQVIRQQADQSFEPGEQSLTPLGLWRRSQESWHHGAGQPFLDGRTGLSAYSQINADPERFRVSKGLDPWTHGQVSLLHPTLLSWSTTGTNLYLAAAQVANGAFTLYVSDGTELYWAALPYSLFNTLALQNGTGWSATNATISATAGYFQLTATSSAAVSATSPTGTGGMPVDPGRTYAFLFESINFSGSGAKTPRVNVTWYTSAGATISSTSPVSASGSDGSGALAFSSAAAPANAAYVSLTVSYTTNWTNGDVHDIRVVSVAPYDDVSTVGYADSWTPAVINDGQAAQTVQSITTDGSYVWAALGVSGIHRTLAGNFGTADVPGPLGASHFCHLVGYANGRLLAAGSPAAGPNTQRNVLYEIGDPLGTPDWYGATGTTTPLMTHPNPHFIWTFISPGRNCIYAGGNGGGNAEIYRVTLEATSTALGPPTHASYLPDGETINALQFYAGGVILGTGRGVRLGQADGQGNIDYGPLIPTSWPVQCLEPQDRYCWFGWTKFDASSSGLGRVDLGFFTDTLTPAWSSDLMAVGTTQGDVQSAVTFAPYGYTANQRPPVRVFTVSGKGVYIEDPTSAVTTGNFTTGTIRYGTTEPKLTRSLDLRHHALPAGASIAAEMQRNQSGVWESIGTSSTTGTSGPTAPYDALSEQAESLEFRFTLNRSTAYTSPELTRWTAKILPLPSTIDETFTLNLHMKNTVDTTAADGQPYHIDVPTEIAYLKALEQARTLVTLQLGSSQFTVYLVQSQFKGTNWNSPLRQYAEGMMTTVWQTVRG